MCIGICINGAPSMTRSVKRFVANIEKHNELKKMLDQVVKMTRLIIKKPRPLKSRLFNQLCQAMESKYE